MISHHSGSFSISCESGDQMDKNDDTESFSGEALSGTGPHTRKRNEGLRNSIRNGNIQIYSPCSKRKVSDNAKKNKDNVSESIRRGRAALAEAEEHIKMFEEYLRNSSSQEKTGEMEFQCEEQITNAPKIFSEESSSPCAPLSKSDSVIHPMVIHQHETCQLGSTDLMKNILKEGEERCKRDEIIAAAFRQGDTKLNAGQQVLKLIEQDGNQTCDILVNSRKQLRRFDPSNLAATRRCALKAAKAAEEKAAHDAQEIRQSNFKARPLPGGIWVKNDPYALTKSALSKLYSRDEQATDGSAASISGSSVIVSGGGITSKTEASSLILNDSSKQLSSRHSEASHMDDDAGKKRSGKRRRDCGKEDLVRKERMYKAVTKMIMNEFAAEGSTEESLSEEEDILSMRQQIAKLKAQLKFKRKQCIKVIDAIDDERKKWDNSNDNDSSIFGDIDVNVSESIADNDSGEKGTIEKASCNTGQVMVTPPLRGPVQSTLYERHQSWLDKLEKRRMKALAQKDNEVLMNMTGKPELNNTNASWIRAKAKHDAISEVQCAKEKALQEKRNAQEQLVQQRESDEADRLQGQILKNNKEIRKGISKKLQSNYANKLACPSTQQRIFCPAKSEEVDKRKAKESESSCQIECEMKKHDKDKMEGTACSIKTSNEEISFAEMGDREFERMVKKLGLQARKGLNIMKNRRTKMRNTVTRDISIMLDPPSQKQDTALTTKQDNTPKVSNLKTNKLIKSVSKTGRFTSGAAQARLMVELKDTDLHEYTVATARSALDAAENECTLQQDGTNSHQHTNNSSYKDRREDPILITVQQEEPYERFEAGKSKFFDRSSSTEKGRFRVRDARNFAPDTMRRVPAQIEGTKGVMLLVGKRRCEGINEFSEELIITVLFDRSLFSENAASEWWYSNKEHFIPD